MGPGCGRPQHLSLPCAYPHDALRPAHGQVPSSNGYLDGASLDRGGRRVHLQVALQVSMHHGQRYGSIQRGQWLLCVLDLLHRRPEIRPAGDSRFAGLVWPERLPPRRYPTGLVCAACSGSSVVLLALRSVVAVASSLLDPLSLPMDQAAWNGSDMGFDNDRGKTLAWAVAVGAISTFLGLCMLFKATAGYTKHIAAFLSVWWFLAVATLTFSYKDNTHLGVYAQASNGFFATWTAFFCSFALMYITWLGHGHGTGGGSGDAPAQDTAQDAKAPAAQGGGTVMV